MEDAGDNSTANSLRMAALALASEDTASNHSIHSIRRIEMPARPQSAPPPELGRWADVEEQQGECEPPQRQQLGEQHATGEEGLPASDQQMLLRMHSAASSIYTTDSASLVAPYTGSSSIGRAEGGGGGGGGGGSAGNHALSGGTLSPQYTLVNSDGASLRVHTGSIRERYLNNRISAIQEDDSDSALLFSTRTVPSVILSPRTATIDASTVRYQHQPYGYGHDVPTFDENDAFSMVSGFSEGGASTTRMRMATDRAYNALRIGPNAAAAAAAASLFSYYSQGSGGANAANTNGGPVYRPVSLATSNSDPGVTSAGSFSEYYYNAGENGSLETQSTDMLSIIRSDVAIYGGASEDIKFPFPPDNLSDFSADLFSPNSFEISSPGAAGTSSQHQQYQQQHQHQHQQRADSFEGNDGNDRPATAAHRAVFGTKIRKKKIHGSRNGRYLYHHRHQPTTPVVAAPAAPATAAGGGSSSGAMQPQSSPSIGHHHHFHHHPEEQQVAVGASSNPGAGAVRPNAIMRFLKRITPRN
ncbi:hypothetical protein LPJ81_000196 [Coemansia sp. IMI 209127]|nr:hypothetical protein LPJ81_000196 [Coemansia sp. IMI 209127]